MLLQGPIAVGSHSGVRDDEVKIVTSQHNKIIRKCTIQYYIIILQRHRRKVTVSRKHRDSVRLTSETVSILPSPTNRLTTPE